VTALDASIAHGDLETNRQDLARLLAMLLADGYRSAAHFVELHVCRLVVGVRCRVGLIAEQVTGLALQRLAKPGQGAEPDRPGPAVLEDGQVDNRDPHLGRQFGERHLALAEQFIQVESDGGRLVLVGPLVGGFDEVPPAVLAGQFQRLRPLLTPE